MTQVRRTLVWFGAALFVASGLAACRGGGGDQVDAGPPTSNRRFPAAVVSTTTPSTTPFGVTVKPANTTTTRKPSSGGGTTIATTTTTTTPAPGRVKPAETPLPGARTGVAGTAWQGVVVVAGGVGSGGSASVRVDAYDPATGAWSRGPNLPVPLHDAAVAVLGDDLWVVGGFTQDGDQQVAQDKTYFFHPGDTAWKEGPALHTARGGAAAATLGPFLLVVGGEASDGNVLASVEVLGAGGSNWRSAPAMSTPRAYLSALAMNGRIYAIGGKTDAATSSSSVESWRSGGEWRTESRLDKDRVRGAGAGACVAGGQNDEGIVSTIECFGTGFWITHAQMRLPRYGMAAIVLDGWLHLIGGSTAGTTVVNTHEVVDLAGA